jgi:nitrogen fixation-related uncharacterized protein
MRSSGLTTSRRPRQALGWGDVGSSTPELVVILPVLLLLVTVGLQFALWALASHALSDSVAQGGAALRAEDATSAAARTVTLQQLQALASDLVLRPSVSTQTLPDGIASLSASGTVPSLLPDMSLTVSAESTGPEQRFRASG